MIFYDKRQGSETGYAVNDPEAIAALREMREANGKPARPQKIAWALAVCIAKREREGWDLAWAANEEFGKTRGATAEQLFAARQVLIEKYWK
jgi:hypothetical protein